MPDQVRPDNVGGILKMLEFPQPTLLGGDALTESIQLSLQRGYRVIEGITIYCGTHLDFIVTAHYM